MVWIYICVWLSLKKIPATLLKDYIVKIPDLAVLMGLSVVIFPFYLKMILLTNKNEAKKEQQSLS